MSELSEWLAKTMRGERNTTALVIQGGRGSGKGVAVRMIEAALPGNLVTYCDDRSLMRNPFTAFQRYMADSDIVVMDEVRLLNLLDAAKNFLTADRVEVQRKGHPMENLPIRANIILLSQEGFPRNEENRRFIVASPIEVIAEMIPHLAK